MPAIMHGLMTEVTVGIDIGTTSVKAVAATGDGAVVARARVPHKLLIPAADRMEHDANQAWRRGPAKALKALGTDIEARAVSVIAMVPSLTAVDRRGIPRTSGLLYGDVRGGGIDAGEMAGFLRWTATQAPDAHGYWPAQAVANRALGGEAVLDASAAGSSSPVFSMDLWDWDPGLGVDVARFPRVAGMGEAVGTVTGTDIVLDAGGVDAVGEQLVAGADEDGDVLVMCGTTLIVWAVAPEWNEVDGLVTVPHMGAQGKQFIGGPSNAGGLFLNWATGLAGRTTKPPSDPKRVPVWAPYPRGERSLVADPSRRAELHGLDLTVDAAGLRRSAFEASGFVTRRIIERSGVTPRRIVATGGGVRVPEWTQALADATGLPVDVVAVPEGAALGAAWMARMAAGLETGMGDARRWARTGQRVEPDPRWQAACDDRYERFLEVAG
jgi:xylulokinase